MRFVISNCKHYGVGTLILSLLCCLCQSEGVFAAMVEHVFEPILALRRLLEMQLLQPDSSRQLEIVLALGRQLRFQHCDSLERTAASVDSSDAGSSSSVNSGE